MHYAPTCLAATDANADQASLEMALCAKVCGTLVRVFGNIIIIIVMTQTTSYLRKGPLLSHACMHARRLENGVDIKELHP